MQTDAKNVLNGFVSRSSEIMKVRCQLSKSFSGY